MVTFNILQLTKKLKKDILYKQEHTFKSNNNTYKRKLNFSFAMIKEENKNAKI